MTKDKKLAACIAALESLAAWGDGTKSDPLVLDNSLDSPGNALLARKTLYNIGYRTRDGQLALTRGRRG